MNNDLSPARRLALMAQQESDEPEPQTVKSVSLRLPIELVIAVDALASLTGQSRNTTMIDVLQVGVYAVVDELDDRSNFDAICDQMQGE